MKILIYNLRRPDDIPTDIPVFRCDRKTAMGNPFEMENESQRKEVIDRYRYYFLSRAQRHGADRLFDEELEAILRAARTHPVIGLSCWCAPKPCHCEVIAKYVSEKIRENERLHNGG